MLHEDVAFKTISDHYTNSRMVPFLTHIDEFRAIFVLKKSSAKKTPTMVNQHFCFHRKIGCNKLFLSNTAEVRSIYLKMGHIMRKPVLSYLNNKGADHPALHATPILFPGVDFFVINPFDRK